MEKVRPRESSGRPYPIPLNFKTKSKSPGKTAPLRFLDYSKLRALEKYLLVVFDVFSFFIAFVCTQFLRHSQFHFQKEEWAYVFWPLTVLLMANYIFDLYKPDFKMAGPGIPGRILFASIASLLLITLSVYLLGVERFIGTYHGRGILLGILSIFSLLAIVHRFFLSNIFKRIRIKRNYLVLATSEEFHSLLWESKNFSESKSERERFEFLSSSNLNGLQVKIENFDYIGIIVGSEILRDSELIRELMIFRLKGIRVFNIHEFFEKAWFKIPVLSLKDQWFVMENGFALLHNPVGLKIKRMLDIFLSLTLIVITLPLMLLTSLLIKLSSQGPILYSQVRTRDEGKNFTLYKFRSMTVGAENNLPQWAKKNDTRVTKIGKWLRIMRIDELPQLWNVLKGDMSFIGPRPERPEFNKELEKKIPYYNLRHLVKPGITGWAQVLYPYGASVEDALEKLQYDLYYIKNYGLLLDFNILIKTARVVLFGKGGR